MTNEDLIQLYLRGEASDAEIQELDEILLHDPKLRSLLISEIGTDAGLRQIAFERLADPVTTPHKSTPAYRPLLFAIAAGVIGVLTTLTWSQLSQPGVIATLVSVENAAWESSLPTAPGSALTPGYLKLTSGIATVRFASGAEVLLEAPANLVLISKMRGRLVSGAAIVSVPEPAIGFVLETPDGYVVDHGTQFSVNIEQNGKSDYEVIEGEISLHLASTGEEAFLSDQQSASISQQTLTRFDGMLPENELVLTPPVIRIGTAGRATTVIRNNKRRKRIHPDLLMAKMGQSPNWDLRCFFSFDVSDVNLESMESVRLRLNMVPSGIGFATRLPKINRFEIYGVTNPSKENWIIESLWEDAPSEQDGELVGSFEVPRSQQSGSVGIDDPRLLDFLKSHQHHPITLLLVRETGQVHGEGPGLVHAFASDSHPEASGPILEFSPR